MSRVAKVILFVVPMLVLVGLVCPAAGEPVADLLLYHFDEDAGNIAPDAVYPGFDDGVIEGGAGWTAGKVGNALSFDGSNDKVSALHFPVFGYSALTIEAWIKWGGKEGKQVLFNEQDGDKLWVNLDTTGDDKFDVYLGDTTNKGYHSSNTPIPRDTWTHVAFTYDDAVDELKIYVNGALDNTATTSGTLNLVSTMTMGASWYTGNPFQGVMDEVAVYSYALSPAEIQSRALVPEPSTLVLLLGLVAVAPLAWLRRRRA